MMKAAYQLKQVVFPECAKECAMLQTLGARECESACHWKFDEGGNPYRKMPGNKVKRMGMLVTVYRPIGDPDCSMNGVSSRFERAILAGDGIPEIFEAGEKTPLLIFEPRNGYPRCVPDEQYDRGDGWSPWMFGGNFVYSCDGRFPTGQPIAIHDRQEN